jgi:isopenicillin-N epimerase
MSATIHGVEVSWERARDLFRLDPTMAYLNHGAFGAVPVPVQLAQQRLRDEVEANPRAFFVRGLMDRIGHVRRHVAGFLGADPDGTALVPNATAGLQVALGSFPLAEGDEILLTDHGYGTTLAAAQRRAGRTGATVREVDLPLSASDDEVVELIRAAVRPGRTRLVVVDHVSSPTARLMPVGRVVAALRSAGVAVLVDGAHAAGMLPIDLAAVGADFWVGNLHKWAFAPRPTAALVVAPEHRGRIEPLIVSWEQPAGFPAAVEFAGTLDYTAWLAAPAGLHFLRTLGPERVRQHNCDLADYAQLTVAAAVRADPTGLARSEPVSMRVVPLPAGVAVTQPAADALRDRLSAEHSCEVQVNPWRGRGYLRISAQVYNTKADVDRLSRACEAVLRLS